LKIYKPNECNLHTPTKTYCKYTYRMAYKEFHRTVGDHIKTFNLQDSVRIIFMENSQEIRKVLCEFLIVSPEMWNRIMSILFHMYCISSNNKLSITSISIKDYEGFYALEHAKDAVLQMEQLNIIAPSTQESWIEMDSILMKEYKLENHVRAMLDGLFLTKKADIIIECNNSYTKSPAFVRNFYIPTLPDADKTDIYQLFLGKTITNQRVKEYFEGGESIFISLENEEFRFRGPQLDNIDDIIQKLEKFFRPLGSLTKSAR